MRKHWNSGDPAGLGQMRPAAWTTQTARPRTTSECRSNHWDRPNPQKHGDVMVMFTKKDQKWVDLHRTSIFDSHSWTSDPKAFRSSDPWRISSPARTFPHLCALSVPAARGRSRARDDPTRRTTTCRCWCPGGFHGGVLFKALKTGSWSGKMEN